MSYSIAIFIFVIVVFISGCGHLRSSTKGNAIPRFSHDEIMSVKSISERDIIYYVDRPLTDIRVPLVVVVDGSGCVGQNRPRSKDFFRPDATKSRLYARLRVEKPGVKSEANDWKQKCSEEFLKNYTMDNRVLDHLRVFQHLSATASWWNGEVLLWGWSDGGDIASQLTAYYPNVKKSVLGAMGGGLTMAEHFEKFLACRTSSEVQERSSCVLSLHEKFKMMEDNPTWKETWSGHAESWRVWASRLRSRLSPLLADVHRPFLIVHGALDVESTPVESARELVNYLHLHENKYYTYWEVPNMKHGGNSLSAEKEKMLNDAMLGWLLSEDASTKVDLPKELTE